MSANRKRLAKKVADRLNRDPGLGSSHRWSPKEATEIIDMILGATIGTIVVNRKSVSFDLEGCKTLSVGRYLLYGHRTEALKLIAGGKSDER